MTHDDALLNASARADGEAYDPALDAHLAGCAECAAYADGLARLSTLAAALPVERAPDLAPWLVRRVRRRRALRWSSGLAAATAAAVVAVALPVTDATFPPPTAAAAEPLRRLRSLYAERTITGPDGTTVERVWFRAPASVRIERVVNGGPPDVTIRTPDLRYEGGVLTRDVTPEIALPEPISPEVALLGTDTGPGPTVAGRPTRRLVLTVHGQRRVAYVDASLSLGAEDPVVLGKEAGTVTKRVTRLDVDPAIPDALFTPPAGNAADGGFRTRRIGSLSIEPERLPEGFVPVRAGSDVGGESLLLVDGALPLLVTSRPRDNGPAGDVRTVVSGGRTYLVTIGLYAVPSVEFLRDGVSVKVVAPLPVASLVAMADAMFPE